MLLGVSIIFLPRELNWSVKGSINRNAKGSIKSIQNHTRRIHYQQDNNHHLMMLLGVLMLGSPHST